MNRLFALVLLLGAGSGAAVCAFAAEAPATPAPSPAAAVQVAPDGTIVLRLPDIGVLDTALIYEKLTGKTVVLPSDVSTDVRLTLMSPSPIPAGQAVDFISSALLLNGYALVPAPDNRVKLVQVRTTNPRSSGVPVYTGPASGLPSDLAVVTYFMPFTYLSAAEAEAIIRPQVALNAPYGAIVAVPLARALLITENVDVIRQLIAIKELVDVPPADLRIEFIPLVSANAGDVAETINQLLFGKTPNASQEPGTLNLSVGAAAPGPQDLHLRFVRVQADVRTNRLVVTAPAASMPLLRALVANLDESAQAGAPVEFRLKYVAAADVLPILRVALVEPGKDGTIDTAALSAAATPRAPADGGVASTSKDISARVAVSQDVERATSLIVGKTRLIADNRTNTVVVIGPPSSAKMAEQVLAMVDRPPKQVYLATVIGQMSNTGTQELGVDILQRFRGSPSFGAGSISRTFPVSGPLNPQNVQIGTNAITQAASGITVYGLAGNTIAYYVRALQETNRFRILSRPSVYTSNNKKAIISSGSQQPVPSATQSNLVNSAPGSSSTVLNTTVEYKNVVLELAVVPLINAKNEVTLNIAQRNDSLGDEVQVGSTTARAINTQELTTSITVPNGETVVLGGLLTDRDDLRRTGTPILSDLPILGLLFSNTRKVVVKTELIILIQPIVIESPELTQLQRDQQTDVTPLERESTQFLDQPAAQQQAPVPNTKEFLRDALSLPKPQGPVR